MKFRVTAVIWQDCFDAINAACLRMEDWLTASLSDGSYGDGLEQVCFVVVATEEDHDLNLLRAAGFDKLGRYTNPLTSLPVRYLSFGLSIPYATALSLSAEQATESIAQLISQKAAKRPKRLPKGFDYGKLSAAIQAATKAFAPAA